MDRDETTAPDPLQVPVSPGIAPDGSEPDLDRSAFDNLAAELGREDTLQTFSAFFNEADNRIKSLCELSGVNDRDAIKREAHALKGSAANFGFRQVSHLSRMLEQDAHVIPGDRYEAALRRLEASYAAARACFAKLVA